MQKQIVSASRIIVKAQFLTLAINFASLTILARLIAPKDYGLIAIVVAITNIFTLIRDGGLVSATIQKDKISDQLHSNLFWINLTYTIIFSGCIMLLGPLVSSIYGYPELNSIALTIGLIFLLDGISNQHLARLKREMMFNPIEKIQVASLLVGFIAAVIAASAELGYWAILIQMGFTAIFKSCSYWMASGWSPKLPRPCIGTKEVIRYGVHCTSAAIANYAGRNFDDISLGYVWGSPLVGVYSKAYSLLMLPIVQINQPISRLGFPALCKLKNDPDDYRKLFRKMLLISCSLSFPAIFLLVLCRKEVIYILLGPAWMAVVPIFAALSISALCQPIGNLSGLLFTSLGNVKRMNAWSFIGNGWIISGILIGLKYGAIGVALGYSIATFLMMLPLAYFSVKGTFLGLDDYWKPIARH